MRRSIAICTDLPVYEQHLPPFDHISCVKRLAITVASPLLRPLAKARYKSKMSRVSELLVAAQRCNTREALEQVLGKPAYALAGPHFVETDTHGQKLRADHVEVYLVSGCTIDVVFYLEEGRVAMVGWPTLTATDVALMHPDRHGPPATQL